MHLRLKYQSVHIQHQMDLEKALLTVQEIHGIVRCQDIEIDRLWYCESTYM